MDSLSDEKKCAIKVCGPRLSSAGFVIILRSALLVGLRLWQHRWGLLPWLANLLHCPGDQRTWAFL